MTPQEKFDEFMDKVKELKNEYNVTLYFGCGCCGTSYSCDGETVDGGWDLVD